MSDGRREIKSVARGIMQLAADVEKEHSSISGAVVTVIVERESDRVYQQVRTVVALGDAKLPAHCASWDEPAPAPAPALASGAALTLTLTAGGGEGGSGGGEGKRKK